MDRNFYCREEEERVLEQFVEFDKYLNKYQ